VKDVPTLFQLVNDYQASIVSKTYVIIKLNKTKKKGKDGYIYILRDDSIRVSKKERINILRGVFL